MGAGGLLAMGAAHAAGGKVLSSKPATGKCVGNN